MTIIISIINFTNNYLLLFLFVEMYGIMNRVKINKFEVISKGGHLQLIKVLPNHIKQSVGILNNDNRMPTCYHNNGVPS